MGLATSDPHSHKVQTKLYKIPKFGVIQDLKVSKIQEFENLKIYKEMYGHPDAVRHSVRMAIHFFVNFDIFKWLYLAYYWANLHQLWDFVKLGLHVMTM